LTSATYTPSLPFIDAVSDGNFVPANHIPEWPLFDYTIGAELNDHRRATAVDLLFFANVDCHMPDKRFGLTKIG
jgi:hypothetical protein